VVVARALARLASNNRVIRIKRAYAPATVDDGARFLVDRLWPRGRSRVALKLEAWLKDVAPSTALRECFNHDPARWAEFQERYRQELASPSRSESMAILTSAARLGDITLVYGARDERHNDAVVLLQVLAEQLGADPPPP
jgi:uncharacterized protein YeaO (DUF488 family)